MLISYVGGCEEQHKMFNSVKTLLGRRLAAVLLKTLVGFVLLEHQILFVDSPNLMFLISHTHSFSVTVACGCLTALPFSPHQ